jgi:imidazolonepropionase-like amidohydrolase
MRIVFILSFLGLTAVFAQVPSPIAQKYERILFKNGRAHIGNGTIINSACIGVTTGKVSLVKNALTYTINPTEWDTIIDLRGKQIYPGFIAANLTIGLTEIDAVRATRDFDEVGTFNPNVRALIAYNTDSKVMYTVRTNGILVAQSTPRGGTISGTSSVMALDGWNWEDAVYLKDDGIHLNWPKKYQSSGWWAEPKPDKSNEKYTKELAEINAFFEAAQAYLGEKDPQVKDLRYAAMNGIFDGSKRLYIHADFAPEINDIIDFSRKYNFPFPVIVGGYDAHLLAERIKENKLSVMLSRPHQLPEFDEDMTYAYYQKAAILQRAGIPYCIQGAGDMEVMNARNLPFLAGTAWAYGLTEEEAVASISLNVAKIMGIDQKIGSLEVGKDATLFISTGNALDMRSNNVEIAMVKGRFIELNNHQMQLNEKYRAKYGLK